MEGGGAEDVGRARVGDEGVEALEKGVIAAPALRYLSLLNNDITTRGARAVGRMIGEVPHWRW